MPTRLRVCCGAEADARTRRTGSAQAGVDVRGACGWSGGARTTAEATRISTWLHAFDYLGCEEGTFARALETQRHALNAGFHRALSLPDLLIAATAELHRRTVLHYDGDFDMIGGITGQPTQWVVPPGAADH